MKNSTLAIAGFVLILAAGVLSTGIYQSRQTDRIVTVKGLSEREAEADLALWPIKFSVTGAQLQAAQKELSRDHDRVMKFLVEGGVDTSMVEISRLDVTDKMANPYQNNFAGPRFILSETIMVRSNQPYKIQTLSQEVGKLVSAGVVLSNENYGPNAGPTYLFTRLSDFKPEMIAEATSEARDAAEQFAKDSGSKIGKIRRANQGVFVIKPRDEFSGATEQSQIKKKIRVVSTVEYFLVD